MNVPPRYSRVDPWVISDNTEAEIAFLEAAIQAYETPGSRMLGPDGRIGHVEAVDRAVEAGARLLTQPTESAFGEREARVRDPQGHLWWVHERFEDVAPADLAQRFADPGAKQAMAYVQDSLTNEPSRARYAIPAERSCGWWRCPAASSDTDGHLHHHQSTPSGSPSSPTPSAARRPSESATPSRSRQNPLCPPPRPLGQSRTTPRRMGTTRQGR